MKKQRFEFRTILALILVMTIILLPFDTLALTGQAVTSEGMATPDEAESTQREKDDDLAQTGANILDGDGTEESPYIIATSDDWDTLSESINSGSTEYSGGYFLLTDDISVTTVLGNRPDSSSDSNDNVFCGTFDGDGHKLTVNLNETDFGAAPFAIAHNATIKNLRVDGTINSTAFHASGLVAASKGKSIYDESFLTIQNVTVSVDVSCTSHIAGLIGHAHAANITMENVVFDGSLNASNIQGGMIGWGGLGNGATYSASFKDCLFAGTYNTNAAFYPIAYANGQGTTTLVNDFYTTSFGSGGSPIAPTGDGQLKLLVATVEKDGAVNYFDNINTAADGSNWTQGSTLKLMTDVTTSSTITVPSGEHTLDLNGHGIKMTGSDSVFTVRGGAKLIINDSNPDKEHRFSLSNAQSNGAGLATVNDSLTSGYQTFKGGYITGGKGNTRSSWREGGAIYIEGEVEMNAGTLIGNGTYGSSHGGGFETRESGRFVMNGGCIQNNAALCGGACRLVGGSAEFAGGKVINNVVSNDGGGIHVGGTIPLVLKDCEISGNYANGGPGAGVWMSNDGTTVSGKTVIKENYVGTREDNIEIPSNRVLYVGELTDGASIGITMQSGPAAFTSGWNDNMGDADPSKYFTSDNDTYDVFLNKNGEAEIGVPPVASVINGDTTTNYGSLSDAVNAWTAGSTLKLLTDVTTSGTITVPSGEHTLDLNGHGIKMTGSGSVINVGNGATLNLDDSAPTTEHKFTVANAKSNGAGLATVNDTLTGEYKTFTGGYITGGNATNGGGIKVNGTADLTMNGGTIIGNQSSFMGAGIKADNNGDDANVNITVNGGAVIYNTVNGYGAGICSDGAVRINGGTIAYNVASNNPGGIHCHYLHLNGGRIENNFAGATDYACGAHADHEVYISGNPIVYNNLINGNPVNLDWDRTEYKHDHKLNIVGELTEGAQIGVTIRVGGTGVFTSGWNDNMGDADPSKYFTSDNEAYDVLLNNGEAEIGLPPVASIISGETTTKYSSITDAVNAWTEGSTLKLLADVTVDSTITVPAGEHILDLNGYGILMTGNARVLTINQNASLELNDSDPDRIHYITLSNYRGTGVSDNGEASVSDGSGVIQVTGGYLTGGYINNSGSHDKCGAGVFNWGTFVMNGGSIVGNFMQSNSGAGVRNSGTFTMNDGTIAFNKATGNGGGVTTYVPGGGQGKMTMNGGVISDNYCGSYGGGIQLAGPFELTGGSVIRNTAGAGGSGIYYGGQGEKFKLSGDPVIKDNINNNLYLNSDATFMINGSLSEDAEIGVTMNKNAAFTVGWKDEMGGADPSKCFTSDDSNYAVILNNSGELEIGLPPVASVISGETTTKYSSISDAVNAWTDGSTLKLLADVTVDSTITVPAGEHTLDLNGCTLKAGSAGYSVITVGSGADLTIDDTTGKDGKITGGSVGQNFGGGVTVDGGKLTLKGGAISGNANTYNNIGNCGGGVHVKNSGKFYMEGGEISDNTSYVGGGVGTDASDTTVVITGGAIKNNQTVRFGSAVFAGRTGSSIFRIGGDAQIVDNISTWTADKDGEASLNFSTLRLSGDPTVHGDWKANGTSSPNTHINLDNDGSGIQRIELEGALTNDTGSPSITMSPIYRWNDLANGQTFVFTKNWNKYMGTAHPADYFKLDDSVSGVTVIRKDGEAAFTGSGDLGDLYITFDANEGKGTMDPQLVTATNATLNKNTFTRDGYAFAGWNTEKDGSGTGYTDKASVTLTGDLTLYAQWKEPVASIISGETTTSYSSLSDAVNAWTEGSTLKLLKDVSNDTTITVSAGEHILDLNGHTLLELSTVGKFMVGSGASSIADLTIIDSVGTGVIKHETSRPGSLIWIKEDSSLTLDGGTLEANSSASPVIDFFQQKNASFTMNGGKIIGTANNGAVRFGADCTFTMTGGEISGLQTSTGLFDYSVGSGGAINISGAPVVKNNTANGTVCNFNLPDGRLLNINGEMTDGASVGVTKVSKTGVFTSGWKDKMGNADPSKYFTSDNDDYIITLNDSGEACLRYPDVPDVSAEGFEGDYDGEAHSITVSAPDGAEIKYGTSEGSYTLTDNPTYTEAGTYTVYYEVSKEKHTSVHGSAQVKIDKINATVTITGHNTTVDYDSKAHSADGYDAVASSDLYDVTKDFKYNGRAEAVRTIIGTTVMGLSAEQFENLNANFASVTFEVTDGYVKINPVAVTVTITGHNDAVDYDGKAHSVSGYDVEISNSLYTESDFTFSGTAKAERTDAGTTEMGLAPDQFENNNTNFPNVTFEVIDGYVTIDPKAVTVTIVGHNSTADYDGKAHNVSGYDVTAISESLYSESDFAFNGTAKAERTDAGTTEMGLATEQFENMNSNFAVTFEVTDGYQKINPISVGVAIVGYNSTSDYNGKSHSVSGYVAAFSNPLYTESDFTFSGTAKAQRTDAGTTKMGLAPDQFENTNSNFKNVTFTVVDGYVTINPIDVTVTITGHNNTVDYDGQAHSADGYDATADSKLYDVNKDFIYHGRAEAVRTDAGTTEMGLTAENFENTNANFDTVTFEITDGYMTVVPVDVVVTVTGHHDTVDYDGKAHSAEGYDVEFSNPLYSESDFTFSGTAKAERTDAGTTGMGLAAEQFVNTNRNFANVTFDITDGYMTVEPINVKVVVTGNSDTIDYDGKSHTVSGYTFAATSALYTESDFMFSGTAEATRTDAGTTNMGLAAEQFENTSNNFAQVTFEVTDGSVTIDPIDVTVIVTGHNTTVDYDGKAHSADGYDAKASTDLYDVSKDFIFSGRAAASRTNAGTTKMGLTAEQFENTNSNFATVTFDVTDGYVTIDPIDVIVTITGHHDTVDYDGKAHSVDGYDAAASTDLYDVDGDFTFSGRAEAVRTNAGKTEMGLSADQFANTNSNFATVTFDVTDGYIKIDPIDVTVTVTGYNYTTDYDGETHYAEGYEIEISDPLYTEEDFTFSGTARAERTNAGTTKMGLTADQFENINSNFATVVFDVTDGYVTINPIDVTVTITGHNSTADYDGDAHIAEGYDTDISDPLYTEDDFTFSGNAKAERTNAGKTEMGLTADQFENTNDNFAEVTFDVTDGYITIDPIDVTVTITGHSDTADYDGKTHSIDGYDAVTSSDLYDVTKDFTFSGNAKAERTDAGTTEMGLDAEQFKNTNSNFAEVTFDVTDGYMTIDPIDVTVTITGHNDTADYDGKAHSIDGYDAVASSDLYDATKDFTFSGTAKAERTDAGTTDMGLAAEQFENTNSNFATVTFDVTDGYMTIDPIDVTVTITGHNDTVDYDGKAHSVDGYDAVASSDLYDVTKDFTFSGTAKAERTNAGTTDMGLAAELFNNTNSNFATVSFDVTDGYMTIDPIDVKVVVTGNSDKVDYDGKSHTVSGYTFAATSALYTESDFTFSGTAEAERTDAGTTKMGLAAEQFKNTSDNFADVTFEVTDGSLTIDPIDVTVTITGHNDRADYDGKAHSVEGYDVEISDPLYTESDFTFSGTATAERTNAGTTMMGLSAEQFENTNDNFAEVTFDVTDGGMTIDPINVTVTITGHNSTENYDGKAHSVSGYDAVASSDLYDVNNDFTFSGTAKAERTDAGTTEMGLSAEQFENTNNNFATVTFDVTDGYMTINPINVTVTITGHNNTVDYDGEAHSADGYDAVASSDLYDVTKNIKFSGIAKAERTNAGTTEMGLAAEQFENTNNNFATVTFDVTDGYMTIDPIDVTVSITGHNDTVDYDGKAHSVEGYDAVASSDLYDVTKDFTFSGTAKAERTNAGTTEMGLAAEQFKNTNSNFATVTFDVTDGYMTIDQIDVTVTITGHNDTVDYDGKAHSVEGYNAVANSDLYDVTKDIKFSGTAKAERTDAGTTEMGLSAEQFENTNSNFATVTFDVTDGFMTVKPINVTVTITGHNDTVDYDGNAHSVDGYDAVASSDLYDVTKDFTFSGRAEAIRTNAGKTDMGLTAEQFENTNTNFDTVTFEVTDGYIMVGPIDVIVTITGHNSTVDYDGKQHAAEGYDVEISNPLYSESDFTFSGTAKAERTDAGTTKMGLADNQFENTNSNYSTVVFMVTDGYVKVDPIDVTVTVTGHNSTADFDGKAHSVDGYDAVASSDLYDVTKDFTFSGRAEAIRTNAGKTNMGLTADQFENANSNFARVTFDVTDGYMTVKPINATVTITGHSDIADYDGKLHSIDGYDAVASSDLYDITKDFTFSGTAKAERTDAGTTEMGLSAEQFENTNSNFITVTFNVTDGYITVDPIDVTVTITGHNDTVDYDGKSHSIEGYDAVSSSDLYDVTKDFTFSGTAKAERTDAGTTMMELNAEQFENTNNNFATVTFDVTDGGITIDPIDVTVTVTGHNDTVDYDGKSHSIEGYDAVSSSSLYDITKDFKFSGTAKAERTDAGTTNMGLSAGQFENINNNFANVTFDITDGYVKIDPIDVTVTITGHNNTVDYNGNAHSADGYDAAANSDLYDVTNDFTFSGRAEAVRTNAGTSMMGLSAEQFENTNSNFDHVVFSVTDGYLTVNSVDAVITTAPHAKSELVYNGSEQELIVAGSVDGGTLYYAIGKNSDTSPADSQYNAALPVGKDAGNYYIWYKVKGDSNHHDIAPSYVKVTMAEQGWGTVSGGIVDENNNPVSNATVTLTAGGKVIDEIVSGSDGSYYFTVPAGIYNIVVKSDDATVTEMVDVADRTTYDVTVPDSDTDSLLDVADSDSGIVVGGLSKEAAIIRDQESVPDNQNVTVKMTVKTISGSETEASKAISDYAPDKNFKFYGFKVEKTVGSETTELDATQSILEIAVPCSFINKSEFAVYNDSSSGVQTLTESDSKEAGTYRIDQQNGMVYIYTDTIATYAVGYKPYYSVTSDMTLGSYTGDVSVTLTKDGSGETYELNNVSLQNISFKGIPKGTYSMTVTWTDGAENTITTPFIIK